MNTSMQQCPFCDTDIDHAAASPTETSKISRACSDASYLKIMPGILIPFGALVLFPFRGPRLSKRPHQLYVASSYVFY
jgi:hypothetical protein